MPGLSSKFTFYFFLNNGFYLPWHNGIQLLRVINIDVFVVFQSLHRGTFLAKETQECSPPYIIYRLYVELPLGLSALLVLCFLVRRPFSDIFEDEADSPIYLILIPERLEYA